MGAPSSIGRDTIRTFLFSALGSAVGILTGIFLAKTLGPYGKGLFSGVQMLQNIITAATGGAGAAITYMLANQKIAMGALVRPLGALLVAATLLSWMVLAIWGLRYGFNATLLIAAGVIPASITLSWRAYFYMGVGRVRTLNYQSLALTIATLICIVVAVIVVHAGITGVLIAWAIFTYIAAGIIVWDALRSAAGTDQQGYREHLAALLRFGSRSSLSGLLGFLNYRVDSLVLIAYLGASGFGIYSVAVAAAELLFMLPRAIGTAVSRDIGEREFAMSADVTAKAVRLATFSAAALALAIGVAAPTLIHWIYGPRFDPAALPLRILLPGVVAFAAGSTFSAFFSYQLGRPVILTYVAIATIVLQLSLAVMLVPRYGLVGAAAASTAAYLAVGVVVAWYFCRLTRLPNTALWLVKRRDFEALRSLLPGFALRSSE